MPKLRCPSCQARLNVPDKMLGNVITCPKCNNPVTLPQPEEPAEPVATAPASQSDIQFPEPHQAAITSALANEMAMQSAGQKKTRFRFKTYWTPFIVRFSWYVVLLFAVLWAVFLSIGFVATLTGSSQGSMLDSFGMSDLSVSSLDLEGIMNGKADVDSLNNFLDKVTEQGEAGSTARPGKTGFQKFMSIGFTTLSFLTLIASSLLTVLFCRVFFECIAVLFGIAESLKNMEARSDQ